MTKYARGLRTPPHRTYSDPCALTQSEQEIALLVADGLTDGEIGKRLGYARGTVRNKITTIYSKLFIPPSRAALTAYALRNDMRGQVLETFTDPPQISDPDTYRDLIDMAYQ